MGRISRGVEVRGNSIRITFHWRGERCRETLAEPASPPNIKYAERLVAEICSRIRFGSFEYGDYFPDSPRAETTAPNAFGPLADMWLESKGQLEPATLDQYGTAVRFWKTMFGEKTLVMHLTAQVLESKIGKFAWPSAKTHNNYLIALRGIFAFEYRGKRASENPLAGIKNLVVVKKLPDPLTADERDRILGELRERYDGRVWAYFSFAFYSGMRPEEIIALQWSDVDFQRGTVRIQRVRTFKGSERDGSMTHMEREVDLVPDALKALGFMETYTFFKKDAGGEASDIFENPETGRAWHDERSQRDNYWTPSLKRLGIRSRRAYSTRHTYCTVALMHGVNPAYIASQAGHSVRTLLEKYARWISGADGGSERLKLIAAMDGSGGHLPHDCPKDSKSDRKLLKSNENLGRHDWTRTNDPYHVKVVL